MKILKSQKFNKPFISIVCCLHGDEKLGLRVFRFLKKKINNYSGLQIIIANEKAGQKNKRFIDQDLNRSFPGRPDGNYEERLAARLLKIIAKSQYLIDIHTTVSDIDNLTIFFAKNNRQTRNIINLFPVKNIVFVRKFLAKKSLIGNVENGVSLEFKKTSQTTKVNEIISGLIKNLYADRQRPPQLRNIYIVDATIPKKTSMSESSRNFKFNKKINGYPVLISKNGYREYHGLKASKKTERLI